MKPSTDKRYPKCSAAGLLRPCFSGEIIVSSSALYELWGDKKYREKVPELKHAGMGWEPASVEKHL